MSLEELSADGLSTLLSLSHRALSCLLLSKYLSLHCAFLTCVDYACAYFAAW